ncbi:Gfo/Idh/MocA family protein [Segetibacter aerophilus]|uniref:Glycosyl hydrolase family 109 protein 1 n=1 Tax=Segetibacter aerophilus TaxID=670293 RepID=A0A512B6D1_9BACT|nr:Gfo/Idh/MocA family oxidoreductase [Segetibacter aerophilus]GEO07530.1 glycosyl hydrolase family 109 protein 1 [Segetibacter aerophilus]
MKDNRRNFLKLTSLASLGVAGGVMKGFSKGPEGDHPSNPGANEFFADRFNMSGYAAPKIENVRVGFIGLGMRGPTHLTNMTKLSGVSIMGLCDIREESVLKAQKMIDKSGQKPTHYFGDKDAWKKMCDRKDIDLIYIATPWALHVPQAVYAMEQGKHVAIEVPAARTLDECWQLVKTSEKTRKHCMMLENCCYDFFELMTLNMARQGFFGDVIHTEGAYIHYLLDLNFKKDGYYDMWRLKENIGRNGNLYPTHGLGPICQVMNINRGDKMDYLVSMSSIDNMMAAEAKERAAKDEFYKPFVNKPYRGNMNTTVIKTNKGRTIMVQHDVTSPNVYSRIHKISGSKGSALKYPTPRIASSHDKWLTEQEFKSLEEKYQPAIVKKVGELAKQVGGHGGMDFLMDWRLIDCLRNGLPLDQDVYDAALWSSVAPLSEKSVANRSSSVDVPDFTGGMWKQNTPVDISLERGGNTLVKL